MKRTPAVAGMFYSENPKELRYHLDELVVFAKSKVKAKGIVSPHAGYVYSGWVAGKVYGTIEPPDVAVILGPNHTGIGDSAAIYPGDAFITPLGEAKINKAMTKGILEKAPFLSTDPSAHIHEHSIEVQVPFLQYINPEVELVAICLSFIGYEEILALGQAIADTIKEFPERNVLVIASSDFSHYVPHEVAKEKDALAIREILNLSIEGLLKVVSEKRISMCGVIPTAVMLKACKELSAKKGILVDYMTSGDVIKDYSSVVGYAGIIIY